VLIARSLYILKYRYIHGLIYAVVGVCLCMSCTHPCTLSWHLQLSGISSWVWNDHHLREIMHQPNWSHTTGDKPYMQHSPLLLRSVEQENKQTKEQTNCNFHSSLLKTLRGKWAGKEYYRSLRMGIHRETRKSACPKEKWNNLKSNLKSTSITIYPLLSWTSYAYL